MPESVNNLNTERSYKRQGQATFEALCWLFFEQWWKAEITVGKHIAFSPLKKRSHFRRLIRDNKKNKVKIKLVLTL